ncbi:MAG: DNA polymerase III subunit delta' [Chromatiales bacterium]|nr:DNA polymerase III subunit delta' [Chromatiales bacterium]
MAGLMQRVSQQRLPHALLLTGAAGLGKRHLASSLSHSLLCESRQGSGVACGQCRSCQLLAAGSHPDYLLVEPEEEGKGIGIAPVREISEFQSLSSHTGRGRVVQIEPVDALTMNAANALLKTLEEPVGQTTLILTSDRPMSLLPTIRSRCQQVTLAPALDDESNVWLKKELQHTDKYDKHLLGMSGGAPLKALRWAESGEMSWREERCRDLLALEGDEFSAVTLAQRWYEMGSERTVSWFYGVVLDLLRMKQISQASALTNPHLQSQLHRLADRVDLEFLQRLGERMQEWMRALRSQTNQQLLLEEMLLAWQQRRVGG